MNNYGICTITRNHGLRAVSGATFTLDVREDGRHFVKSKDGSAPNVLIDVALLLSRHVLISQVSSTEKQVTLSRIGLAQDQDDNVVLVLPEEENGVYVPGLTGVTTPALLWMPEPELVAVNTGADVREQCWLMPGLVKLLFMSDLWLEWNDPRDRMEPPHSVKAELHGGQVKLSESRSGYCEKRFDSRLKTFDGSRNRHRLPNRCGGRGVLVS